MNTSDKEVENTNDNTDNNFGTVLAEAREAQNYTLDDVFLHLKIPVQIISAIETNDIEALPEPAYTQGYIRAYARFLEIPEDDVLETYNQAVPHRLASELNYRTTPKDESAITLPPIQNMVTVALAVAGLAAVLYGGIQYYTKKAGIMENERMSDEESFRGNSLDSPGIVIKQQASITEDDELIVHSAETADLNDNESANVEKADTDEDMAVEVEMETETGRQTDEIDKPLDTIKFVAEKGSWMEVRDVNNERLFYNMVPVGGTKVLQGMAPFFVVLGNASTTKVVINDLEVDMSAYIRPNNTAKFKVSGENERVVFH